MTRLTEGPTNRVSIAFRDAALSQPAAADADRIPTPFSLRLTFDERARLEREAGNQPLGAYIRSRLLEGGEQRRRRYPRRRRLVQDEQTFARLLGELGKARLANNLNQLAKAANTGSLPVTPETEAALQAACQDVEWMRDALLDALGLDAGGPS